jgi:hypothetical protein
LKYWENMHLMWRGK